MIEVKDKQSLLNSAAVIRDEIVNDQNTANRVGVMFIDIINNLANIIGKASTINDGLMSADIVKTVNNIGEIIKVLNKPATEIQDGYMTKDLVKEIKAINVSGSTTQATVIQLQKIMVSLNSIINYLNKPATDEQNGYMTSQQVKSLSDTVVKLPTLESNAAQCAESIKTIQQEMSNHNNEIDKISNRLENDYVIISDIVDNVIIAQGVTEDNGSLVYDKNRNLFLWSVTYPGVTHPTYFSTSEINRLVGKQPVPGYVYVCKNVAYIGNVDGLAMQVRTVIETI